MSLIVRPADVRAERTTIVEVLKRELDGWVDDAKYDWLFLDNPFGEARCWILEEAEKDIVGVAAAFPRVVRNGKSRFRAWVLGDFCVASTLRSLGPAVKLQRQAFKAVDDGEIDLWYDFPNRAMMAVHQRMGCRDVGELVRLVYLCRADDVIRTRVGNHALASGLSVVGNAVLSFRSALTSRDSAVSVANLNADFPAVFETGDFPELGIFLEKTSTYLDWRYRVNPLGNPLVLTAAGNDGAIVFDCFDNDLGIIDVLGASDERVFRELVLGVIEQARTSGAEAVGTMVSAQHPWLDRFVNLGFHRRDTVPFVVYSRADILNEPTPWFLMSGDRDLY